MAHLEYNLNYYHVIYTQVFHVKQGSPGESAGWFWDWLWIVQSVRGEELKGEILSDILWRR